MPAGSGACAAAGGGARRAERQSERVVGLQETEETLIWASVVHYAVSPRAEQQGQAHWLRRYPRALLPIVDAAHKAITNHHASTRRTCQPRTRSSPSGEVLRILVRSLLLRGLSRPLSARAALPTNHPSTYLSIGDR